MTESCEHLFYANMHLDSSLNLNQVLLTYKWAIQHCFKINLKASKSTLHRSSLVLYYRHENYFALNNKTLPQVGFPQIMWKN